MRSNNSRHVPGNNSDSQTTMATGVSTRMETADASEGLATKVQSGLAERGKSDPRKIRSRERRLLHSG